MSKISTYPILSTPTLNDLLIGTDVENLNETKNFSLSSIGTLIGQDYVPYIGATGNVDLGIYSIEGSAFIVNGGTASQFLKADGTLDSTFYVPQTRTITINSVGYDLSANRSWDLPTIDSLTTLGTSGAATYIGKVLNIPIYQAQGNYITQLSGEATALGPGNATVTLSNSAVISKVLTGLNITGGNVIATDTILQAFGKVQNQINGLTGGVTYQGTWNASTNTPFLQSSVGTKGYYYVVSVPGTTNLNGITDWQLGDWAIYNGTAWEKVDNTDAVVSVNGYTGAVMLTYSDVGAPPATRTLTINGVGYDLSLDRSWTVGNVRTDQTYADPSWITSLGWSKIINTPTTLAGYGITDGVSTARTLTINGVGYDLTADRTWSVGTVTSVGTTAPLTGGTITGSGTIGITQASAISDGYLSSTDWSTFNSKQNAITASAPLSLVAGTLSITQAGVSSDGYLSSTDWNTFNSKVGGSGTANYLPIWTSSSVLGNSSLSFSLDTLTVGYNSITGGAVSFTNIGLTPYTYSIQMNNFGSPRSTFHNYTDGIIVQAIASTQVSRMFDNGNFILGTGTTDTGHKLTISGDLYVNTIANAIVDTDRFIVSDGGIIKYRTGAQILTDIGAVSSVGLTMPAAFTVSNSPITSSGTIAVTGAGTAAQYIRGDGTLGDFPGGGGGGGASVSYYLNGSVNQGTFGGNTYYEMNKTPILGAGTDFSTSVNGYIAQFITDVGDPDALLIPGGNWNFETYFSASSGGGSPTFYIELYKYDGTTFTLIASNSTNPELIAFGTTVNPYFSALAVPETVLLATDRLAVRIYVSTSGRTITLHTENSNLCQVITTFTTGLTALNGLTKQVQYFSVGTSGTDFNISSSVATHTFNLPTASAVNRGALSSSDWSTFNAKQNALTLTTSGSSGPATLIGATLNIPDYGSALSGYVPYTGASQAVNLGIYSLSAGSLFVNGPAPTSGSYLGFKQATSVTTGGGGYTSISTFGTSQMNFSFAQPSGFKEFKFDVSSITTGVPGGRVYTMPDADGTIALVGGSGVGTVTSVAALTLGTSGTDLSSTVANSTTTPVITLNVPTASATNRGALSAADWSTFNNKQNTITLTTTGTSGAATLVGSTLNIPQYQSVLTNPITGTGTTNYLAKFTGSTTVGNSQVFDNGTNVGIGTTSPYANLDLGASGANNIILRNTTNAYNLGYIGNSSGRIDIGFSNSNSSLVPLPYLSVNSNGNVGIGTTSVSGTYEKLAVAGGISIKDNTNAKLEIGRYNTTGAQNSYIKLGANSNSLRFTNNTDIADIMELTNSGNLGLGVTPSAWLNTLNALQIGAAHIFGQTTGTGTVSLGNNAFLNSTPAYIYQYNGKATRYSQYDGQHQWFNAPSGTAGNAISFTQAMTLDASGRLGIGTASPTFRLDVQNNTQAVARVLDTSTNASLILQAGSGSAMKVTAYNYASSTALPLYIQVDGANTIMQAGGGNLLVGTTSDNGARLQVSGTSTFSGELNLQYNNAIQTIQGNTGFSLIRLYGGNGSSSNVVEFQIRNRVDGGDFSTIGNFSNHDLQIRTNNTARLTIASTGAATFSSSVQATNMSIGIAPQTDKLFVYNASGTNTGLTIQQDGTGEIFRANGNGGANRLVIQQGGNVGIGTSSPVYTLDVRGRIYAGTALLIGESGSGYSLIESTGGNGIWLRPNGVSSPSGMFINTSSNVGIGTSSPSYKLQIRNDVAASTSLEPISLGLYNNSDGGAAIYFQNAVGGQSKISFGVESTGAGTDDSYLGFSTGANTSLTERMRITSGGNVQYTGDPFIYSNTSSGGTAVHAGLRFHSTDKYIRFFTNDLGRMDITSGGNVLIGTTTDSGDKFQVNGTIRLNQGYVQIINTSNAGLYLNNVSTQWQVYNNTSNNFIINNGAGTTALSLTYSTGAATFSSSVTAAQFLASSSSNAAIITSTGTTGYGLVAAGSAGGARDIFIAGQTGFSNGFTVQYTGSVMRYGFQDGNVLIGTTTDVGARLYVDGAFRTGTLTAGTQTAAVDWRLGNARGGAATNNALIRVQINGVLVDLLGNYV